MIYITSYKAIIGLYGRNFNMIRKLIKVKVMRKVYLFFCLIMIQVTINAQDRIFWGVPNSNISSAGLDGSDIQQSVTLAAQTYDMETDFYKNILYWGEGGTVKKANWDGTGVQTLYTTSGTMVGALALDLTNNKLYFSTFGGGSNVIIRRCNLDGTDEETILTSPNASGSTYTLSISPSLQKMYWCEQNVTGNRVMRCNLDGTSIETLLTVSNFIPGMAIDEKNQKLFLAYWQDNQVRTTDMTCSTTPSIVFNASNGTFQMSVSNIENKLYFAEMTTSKIRKCNLDGTSPQDIVALASGQIMALSIPTVPPAPTIIENEKYTFKFNDFLFSGVDKDLLTKIQITSVFDKGTMYLDANSNNIVDAGESIVLNQEISKAAIVDGKLKYIPVAEEFGTPYSSFEFKWYDGTIYSAFDYTQYLYVLEYIAGDMNRNGIIDNGEKTGDINTNGTIDRPFEVAGDRNGNGVIDYPAEIAGDVNGDGIINRPSEVAGDLNGNGIIDRPDEAAGDVNGDGGITLPELAGDSNGDLEITLPELLGDLNGDGILNDGVAPAVTTQAVSSISTTTATGNGNITALGSSNPTAYGVCWNTTGTPTTSNSYVDNGAISDAGAFTASMTGLVEGTTYYVRAFATNSINISYGGEVSFTTELIQTTPSITWNNPDDITYGTLLSATQLNAAASVPGTYTYTPASGAKLSTGTAQNLKVDFTPTDIVHYFSTSKTVTINVGKATPEISWSNPAVITYGTLLSATQLNATADVEGSMVYTPALGVELNAGTAQSLTADFTPTDATNYNTATKTVSIDVAKASSVITWSNPGNINNPTSLSSTQLNATANVPGTYTYTPGIGIILNVGNAHVLKVDFEPTDNVNYGLASKTVLINVLLATAVSGADVKKLVVYPNPVVDAFKVSGFDGKATISLTDLGGRVFFTREIFAGEQIFINTLLNGIYIIKLTTIDGTILKKLVKE
jgi:hypothetical protein